MNNAEQWSEAEPKKSIQEHSPLRRMEHWTVSNNEKANWNLQGLEVVEALRPRGERIDSVQTDSGNLKSTRYDVITSVILQEE